MGISAHEAVAHSIANPAATEQCSVILLRSAVFLQHAIDISGKNNTIPSPSETFLFRQS